jgi:hypothetical protein
MKFFAAATSSVIAILLIMSLGEAFAGVSISVGEPGFYGRLDIGNYPQPQLIYPQPVVIGRPMPGYQPIYLRVPPKHRNNWKRYCDRYNACGYPVYFVNDNWYQNVYVPRYRQIHRPGGPPHPPPGRPGQQGPPPRFDHR